VLALEGHRIRGAVCEELGGGWLLLRCSATGPKSVGAVGFLLSPLIKSSTELLTNVSDRIMSIRIKTSPAPNMLELICVYSPTATPQSRESVPKFYADLNSHLDRLQTQIPMSS
jgi:hypothetical protein